jgi:hypothetical protein
MSGPLADDARSRKREEKHNGTNFSKLPNQSVMFLARKNLKQDALSVASIIEKGAIGLSTIQGWRAFEYKWSLVEVFVIDGSGPGQGRRCRLSPLATVCVLLLTVLLLASSSNDTLLSWFSNSSALAPGRNHLANRLLKHSPRRQTAAGAHDHRR